MPHGKKVNACGVVPLGLKPEGFVVLVIRHQKGHWAFPKGRPVSGESEHETASREFSEETGIQDAEILKDAFFTEHYSFRSKNQGIQKSVKYFLGLVRNREVRLQEEEIQDSRWLSFHEAMAILTFSEARILLASVKEYVEKNSARLKKALG